MHIRISLCIKFPLRLTIFISFGPNFEKNGYFWSKSEKVNKAIEFFHVRLCLRTKFHLKLTTLIFWTKYAQKEYFQSKTKKLNSTIEFFIFKLFWVPKFNLKSQFWYFGPNLPKQAISHRKWNKLTAPLNSSCWS